jgi:hypothetical protein
MGFFLDKSHMCCAWMSRGDGNLRFTVHYRMFYFAQRRQRAVQRGGKLGVNRSKQHELC